MQRITVLAAGLGLALLGAPAAFAQDTAPPSGGMAPGGQAGQDQVGSPSQQQTGQGQIGAPQQQQNGQGQIGAPQQEQKGEGQVGAPQQDQTGQGQMGAPGQDKAGGQQKDQVQPKEQSAREPAAVGARLSSQDEDFLRKASLNSMFQVKIGGLAKEKVSTKSVKDLANDLVRDHQKALTDLQQIATREKVQLPEKISDDQQADFDRLSALNGKEFDRAFLEQVSKDHSNAVSAFEKEKTAGKSSQLRNYASRELPTLKKHHNVAERDINRL